MSENKVILITAKKDAIATAAFVASHIRRENERTRLFLKPYFELSGQILAGDIPAPQDISPEFVKAMVSCIRLYQIRAEEVPNRANVKFLVNLALLEDENPEYYQKLNGLMNRLLDKNPARSFYSGTGMQILTRIYNNQVSISVFTTQQVVDESRKTSSIKLQDRFAFNSNIWISKGDDLVSFQELKKDSAAIYNAMVPVEGENIEIEIRGATEEGFIIGKRNFYSSNEVEGRRVLSRLPIPARL